MSSAAEKLALARVRLEARRQQPEPVILHLETEQARDYEEDLQERLKSSRPMDRAVRLGPVRMVPLAEIDVDVNQARGQKARTEQDVATALSIAEWGLIQPVLLERPTDSSRYRVIAGNRRVVLARVAGETSIPAFLPQGLTAKGRLAVQVIENMHRLDLTAQERWVGLEAMIDLYGGIRGAALALGVNEKTIQRCRESAFPKEQKVSPLGKRISIGQFVSVIDYWAEHEDKIKRLQVEARQDMAARLRALADKLEA